MVQRFYSVVTSDAVGGLSQQVVELDIFKAGGDVAGCTVARVMLCRNPLFMANGALVGSACVHAVDVAARAGQGGVFPGEREERMLGAAAALRESHCQGCALNRGACGGIRRWISSLLAF